MLFGVVLFIMKCTNRSIIPRFSLSDHLNVVAESSVDKGKVLEVHDHGGHFQNSSPQKSIEDLD